MRVTVVLTLLIAAVSTCVVGALQCQKLDITLDAYGTTCGSCNQWAMGHVLKEGSDQGLLCLFLCGRHSFNVCDQSLTLWVGTDWNYNCYNVPSDLDTVNWSLESSREDWSDERGAYAEVYIYIPCLNCSVKHVTPKWPQSCPSCEGCQ